MRQWRPHKIFIIFVFTLFGVSTLNAQIDIYTLRSALILKMINFIEWPNPLSTPLEISVIGEDQCYSSLQILSSTGANGRSLLVTKKTIEELTEKSQIVYACTSNSELKKISEKLKNKPVLTVTQAENGIRDGFIVNFFEENSKLRFEIDNQKAKNSQLKISSQLLKLAKITEENP